MSGMSLGRGAPTGSVSSIPIPMPTSAPGESGFHVLGKLYRGFIEWIEQTKPRTFRSYLDAIEDDALADYLAQSFAPRAWYDAFPLVALMQVAAKIEGMSFDDFCLMRARTKSKEELSGVYGLFLKVATPRVVADHLPRMAGHYFDFGAHEQEDVGPRAVQIRRRGMPIYLAPWFAGACRTFIQLALEASGAKDVRTIVRPFTPEGITRGLEIVTIEIDLTWS